MNSYDAYQSGGLIYINDDDIPELLLYLGSGARASAFQFCWIDDGVVKNESIGAALLKYRERKGQIYTAMFSVWILYEFDGNQLISSMEGFREMEGPDTSGEYIYHYRINNEEVSEEEYCVIPNDANNWTYSQDDYWFDKSEFKDFIEDF